MSIHLSDEDRANLERLEERRMKSTRRQKAIALLRLAEGLTTREAAMHAGISKEEVEALAVEFAESGLAGIGLVGKSKTLVQLVRPGVGAQRYHLESGATLGTSCAGPKPRSQARPLTSTGSRPKNRRHCATVRL